MLTVELNEDQLAEVQFALRARVDRLEKLAGKNTEEGVSNPALSDRVALINGRGEKPGLMHSLYEWEPIPNPNPSQVEAFGPAQGPWIPEQSGAGYRIRNKLDGEVRITITAKDALTRAADLNQAWADQREDDNRNWTND